MANANSRAVTVDGVTYPGKLEAGWALHLQGGRTLAQIAEAIGSTKVSVEVGIKKMRKRLAAQNPDATPGQWTPEKRDKVRRLFGKTMILIADAVQVPASELLTYVLHGVIPPSQAIKDPGDIRWTGEQAQLAPPAADEHESAILPREAFEGSDTDPDVVDADHLVAPDRDDDEADLAALEAAEVAPPAQERFQPAAPIPRPVAGSGVATPGEVLCLMDEMGRYLHESLDGMTTNPRFAWKGGADKVTKIVKQLPHLKQLDQVAYTR